jgi:hypothetical protein
VFTKGNAEEQSIENKPVRIWKQLRSLQFPIGDDVSAFHPLRSSADFRLKYADTESRTRNELGGPSAETDAYLADIDPPLCSRSATMQIESGGFIMQGWLNVGHANNSGFSRGASRSCDHRTPSSRKNNFGTRDRSQPSRVPLPRP